MSNKAKAKTTKKTAPKQTKMSSVQKLNALEEKLLVQDKNFMILAEEIDKLNASVKGLAKRLNAAIRAGETGEISSKSVKDIILQDNIKELKGNVDFLIEQGILTRDDSMEINLKTFVVGREIDDEGNETNPRTQFSVESLPKLFVDKLVGHKVGDVFKIRDEDPSLEVLEIYKITEAPKMDKIFEEEEEASEEESLPSKK